MGVERGVATKGAQVVWPMMIVTAPNFEGFNSEKCGFGRHERAFSQYFRNAKITMQISSFQVGCPKIATRIRLCAKFSIPNPHQKGTHAWILVAIFGQQT